MSPRIMAPNRFGRAGASIIADLDILARKAAFDVEKEAKREAPVDTGNLASLIYVEKVGVGRYVVRSDAEYSAAVHEGADYGTWFRHGNPYLTRAVETVKPRVLAAAGRLGRRAR